MTHRHVYDTFRLGEWNQECGMFDWIITCRECSQPKEEA